MRGLVKPKKERLSAMKVKHGWAKPPLLWVSGSTRWVMGKTQDGGKFTIATKKSNQKSKKVEFTKKLRPALQRAKTDCLSDISAGNGIKEVNDFFKELDGAVGVLEHKYSKRSRDSNIQRLLPSCGMVARALEEVHSKIICCLSSRPKISQSLLSE